MRKRQQEAHTRDQERRPKERGQRDQERQDHLMDRPVPNLGQGRERIQNHLYQ
ncbi:MAG: hypothetical protein GY861_00220 [bacterium]|nr:hypothetical protein [bacterium]